MTDEQLTEPSNMTVSFSGGVFAPVSNKPHLIVAYVKGRELIYTDVGDCGDVQAAMWQMTGWVEKVSAEMGYKLLMASLIDPEIEEKVRTHFRMIAAGANLTMVCQPDWKG